MWTCNKFIILNTFSTNLDECYKLLPIISIFYLQTCPFIVGTYGYDNKKVRVFTDNLSQGSFTSLDQNAILDYGIQLRKLNKEVTWDSFEFTSHLNFTNGGFELIMKRHKLKYIINHYLPSGLFVIVSWVIRTNWEWAFDWASLNSVSLIWS